MKSNIHPQEILCSWSEQCSKVQRQIIISLDVTFAYKIGLDEKFCETNGQMQFQ